MKKILLAGRSGYIGSYIYDYYNNKENVSSIIRRGNNEEKNVFNLDLTNLQKVNEFAKSAPIFDCLIFLVGLAHSKGKNRELIEFENINYKTLYNLLNSLYQKSKLPKKIVFSSSISVYGEKEVSTHYYENSEKTPHSPYARTKLQAEKYLLSNFIDNSWVLRFSPVYFYGFKRNIERRTKIGNFYYKVGDGNLKLSLCNVENIVIAIDGILNDKIPVGIYNVSDNVDYSYNDILIHQNAKNTITIPKFIVKFFYFIGKIFRSNYLKENSIKLLSDNIYPSDKIHNYIKFNSTLNDFSGKNTK